MPGSASEIPAKEKILSCAAKMFAEKGFTETSIRELATAVGLKGSSIYNHFPSKNTILEHMLEDYFLYNTDVFNSKDIVKILTDNPTTDGILSCLQLSFPPDRQEYFQKVLFVILQEQLRNPIVRGYTSDHMVLRTEKALASIISVLIELGYLRTDTDNDYWIKTTSCIFYSFATRMMLGIGDTSPDFSGRGMAEMLRYTFDLMFEKYGTEKTSQKRDNGS